MDEHRRSDEDEAELARLHREADARDEELEQQSRLIARLRRDAKVHAAALREIREALDAAELELDDLRAVRDALTPDELPERPGLTFTVSFEAATDSVSGDFYLVAEGPQDSTVVVVGDVAGKGIEAARQAAFLRATIASTARFSDDPCRLLGWANVAMTERAGYDGRFATAACVTFDPERMRIRWATAGHPPPLRLGTAEELSSASAGVPLGVMEDLHCASDDAELPAGSAILLYTDGLIEARSGGRLFGVERATSIVREMAASPPSEVVERLRSEATAFGDTNRADDLCLFALQAT